jgi:hypothetical protein
MTAAGATTSAAGGPVPASPDPVGKGARVWGQSTPGRLWRMLAAILAATILLWITATIVVQGGRGTVQSVRDSTAPAFLDATEAHAALSDADRAAWLSFRSGAAQLTGPGQQYQNDITTAGQDLERLAALEPPGGAGSQQLQTISGQLVTYQALVEQADAANRTDIALGAASDHDLGYAYLTYASNAMRDPQGGLLASIDAVTALDRGALDRQVASPWTNPWLLLTSAAAAGLLLWVIVTARGFMLRRFRRVISPPLLLAAALVCGLLVWTAMVTVSADSAFGAARGTALPKLTGTWQAQIQSVDAKAAALRKNAPGSAAAARSGGLNVTATQSAGNALDGDLASAEDTGGLQVAIPALALAIAALAYLGIKPRLDEYRG